MSDISDLMKNFSGMLEGKQIPEDIQNMLNSLMNSKHETPSSNSNFDTNSQDSPSTIDPATIIKMQNIMSAMKKSQKNNPRADLLRSLKPYLNPSRREKVDQYINLFNMEQIIEMLNINGGDKKDGS